MAITVISKSGEEVGLGGYSSVTAGGRGSGTIAGPASYATGGFAADIATDFGLTTEPDVVHVSVKQTNSTRAYDGVWDFTNKKIVVYTAGTTTEVSAAVDLSAVTFLISYASNEA